MLTADEIDEAGEEGVKESHPELSQFKEQVDGFEALYDEVEALKVQYTFYEDFECICTCILVSVIQYEKLP